MSLRRLSMFVVLALPPTLGFGAVVFYASPSASLQIQIVGMWLFTVGCAWWISSSGPRPPFTNSDSDRESTDADGE